MLRFVKAWGVRICAAFLLSAFVILLLPESLGVRLLGATWNGARAATVGVALMLALTAATRFASVALRASGRTRSSFLIRSAHAPFLIAAGLTGAVLGGAGGAAMAFAVIQGVMLLVMRRSLAHKTDDRISATVRLA
jgi:O-antigen/teichoic acid export membrane protein